MFKGIRVLSLFDGMSCGQIALERAGIKVDKYYASEIDKYAITVAKKNYPDTIHLGDVTKVDGRSLGHIDLLIGGSPCFTAETLVITERGALPIREVQIGDMVLTHKNRFRKVLRVGGQKKDTRVVKAQGLLNTTTTDEHPYYCRSMTRKWDNTRRTSYRSFSEPHWKAAKELGKGDFIGLPIIQESENLFNVTPEEAWILGRYIADGHTRKDLKKTGARHWQLILSVGSDKIGDFKSVKSRYSIYPHSASVYRVVFSSKRLVELAENLCGCGAANKQIHTNLLKLPVDVLKHLLEGYISGDGSKRGHCAFRVSTISEKLALSVALAVAKCYGTGCGYSFTSPPSSKIIEGRSVKQSPYHTLEFRKSKRDQSNFVLIDGVVWLPVRSNRSTGGTEGVYNLEVEEDNSYTANGAIVHNCQGFSFCGKQLNFEDPRSRLFFEFVRLLKEVRQINPDVKFLLENVLMKQESKDVITRHLGVEPILINSALVSAQVRKRLYWTNIYGVSQPEDKGIILADILEEQGVGVIKNRGQIYERNEKSMCLDANYHKGPDNHGQRTLIVGDSLISAPLGGRIVGRKINPLTGKRDDYNPELKAVQRLEVNADPRKSNCLTTVDKDNVLIEVGKANVNGHDILKRVYSVEGKGPALTAVCGGNQEKKIAIDHCHWRKLTPLECERLQTVPDHYTAGVSASQRYKMLGNGWTVDVIAHIFRLLPYQDIL